MAATRGSVTSPSFDSPRSTPKPSRPGWRSGRAVTRRRRLLGHARRGAACSRSSCRRDWGGPNPRRRPSVQRRLRLDKGDHRRRCAERLLAGAAMPEPAARSAWAERDVALVATMGLTGLSISELLSLKPRIAPPGSFRRAHPPHRARRGGTGDGRVPRAGGAHRCLPAEARGSARGDRLLGYPLTKAVSQELERVAPHSDSFPRRAVPFIVGVRRTGASSRLWLRDSRRVLRIARLRTSANH
jgi:hypothetical protein